MKTRPLYLSALLLLAACGGDDTAKQPSPDRLEKELVDALRRCDLISAGTLLVVVGSDLGPGHQASPVSL